MERVNRIPASGVSDSGQKNTPAGRLSQAGAGLGPIFTQTTRTSASTFTGTVT